MRFSNFAAASRTKSPPENPTKLRKRVKVASQTATIPAPLRATDTGVLLPAYSLWWREVVRFYRQRSRVVGVIASRLVFWLVSGSGFGTSFRSGQGAGPQH